MIKRTFFVLAWLLTSVITGHVARAQLGDSEFLPPREAFQVVALPTAADKISVQFLIQPGYYIYRHRLSFDIDTASGEQLARLGTPVIPEGKEKEDEFFGLQQVYYDYLEVAVPVSRAAGGSLELPLTVGLQGCADAGLCYPPEKRRMTVVLPATASDGGAFFTDAPSSAAGLDVRENAGFFVSEQDRLAALIRDGALGWVLITFFGLGLLLAFTPCVLPMVPILSGIIAGQGAISTSRAFVLSLTYVLGMAVVNTLAGVAAAAAGQQVQALFQQPWIISVFAGLFVLFALSMFGLFTIQLPSALQSRLSDVSNRQRAGTLGGVAVMGGLSALIVSACVAPPLFAALAVMAQTGDVWRGGSALFVMSLGMGTPLLIIGTSAGRLLPKAGAWMETVKKFFGVLMLGVAAWMLERITSPGVSLLLWAIPLIAAAVLLLQIRSRTLTAWLARGSGAVAAAWAGLLIVGFFMGGRDPFAPLPQLAAPVSTLEFRKIKTVAELDREVAAAAAAGRPVMLDFYADWCVSCKEMERDTFTDDEVQAALSDAVLLKADVTANDEADQALLQRFEIFGPPTIAFWDRSGAERANFRVVGFMPPEDFAVVIQLALAP
ncbi:MAG: protein-disulfide reductase DsbD [Steroidobacteraceae bacterium]|jgi:thiol:disulfide interchange protein DsbD|nr:protein-disulfide reductase DsbD [Gammaproteobacteria bacterium]